MRQAGAAALATAAAAAAKAAPGIIQPSVGPRRPWRTRQRCSSSPPPSPPQPRSQLTRQVTRGRRTVAGGGAASLSRAPFCGSVSSGFFPFLWASSGRAGPVQPGLEVFVDGVPGGAPRVELRDLFEVAVPGVVVKVALMKQFAFIQLCDEVAVECAIQKLNGHLLHCHRVVVVEFSRPRPTHTVKTFVGNVSATCTSGELRVLFQEFGPVIECHIVKGVGESPALLPATAEADLSAESAELRQILPASADPSQH
ncbi:RNA-binding protein 14-like [Crotalus adamanteus]|uniref:RNA-binding protein 14-like n=1 Tax=Crotalus adamanteus TaxID=8729 RepID=A0AAW1B0M0_CROAD